MTSYQDVLDSIEATEYHLKRTKKETDKLRRFFEQHGCYDEHEAEQQWSRQQAVTSALHKLYAQLPNLANT